MKADGDPKTAAWFDRESRIAALRAEAGRWLHTPFAPNSNTPGPRGGVSCQMLASAIYRGAGFGCIVVPPVAIAHARFSRESLVEAFMATRPEFRLVNEQPLPGDLLGFQIGRTVHHLGITLDRGEFVHVLDAIGCVFSQLSDPTYSGALRRVWRPVTIVPSPNPL